MKNAVFGSINQKLVLCTYELDCYVLDDMTRVVAKTKFEKVLGMESKFKKGIIDFLLVLNNNILVSEKILQEVSNPISFLVLDDAQTPTVVLGYNSDLFIVICELIQKAKNEGLLTANQIKQAKISEKILKSLDKKNINSLIDSASGFTFFKETTKENFKNYLLKQKQDTCFEWVVTFSDDFYEEIFVFLNTSWQVFRKAPFILADFIYNSIFMRIDDKTLIEIRSSKPKRSYVNKNGVLLNREHPTIQIFNHILQSFLIESNYERSEFMQLLIKNYPKNTLRESITFNEIQTENLTLFNEKLQIGMTRF